MPKVRRPANLEKDDIVRAYIAKGQARLGLKNEEIATKMHTTRQTLKNKYDRPGTFTLSELRELQDILKLTDVEKASMILGADVAQVIKS